MSNDEFQPVTLSFGNYVKWDDSQIDKVWTVTYERTATKTVGDDTYTDHHVVDDEGQPHKFNGNVCLDTFFGGIEPGTRCQIIYKGKVKAGARKVHQYEFAIAKPKSTTAQAAAPKKVFG